MGIGLDLQETSNMNRVPKMNKDIIVPSDILKLILQEEDDVVEDKLINTTRWSSIHRLVFRYNGKLYETTYSKGLTEQQDEQPFQYSKNVVCHEVEPVEVLSTQYLRKLTDVKVVI